MEKDYSHRKFVNTHYMTRDSVVPFYVNLIVSNGPILKRWRKKFRERNEFNKLMQEVAREYLKKHPEYDITSPHFKETMITPSHNRWKI